MGFTTEPLLPAPSVPSAVAKLKVFHSVIWGLVGTFKLCLTSVRFAPTFDHLPPLVSVNL